MEIKYYWQIIFIDAINMPELDKNWKKKLFCLFYQNIQSKKRFVDLLITFILEIKYYLQVILIYLDVIQMPELVQNWN